MMQGLWLLRFDHPLAYCTSKYIFLVASRALSRRSSLATRVSFACGLHTVWQIFFVATVARRGGGARVQYRVGRSQHGLPFILFIEAWRSTTTARDPGHRRQSCKPVTSVFASVWRTPDTGCVQRCFHSRFYHITYLTAPLHTAMLVHPPMCLPHTLASSTHTRNPRTLFHPIHAAIHTYPSTKCTSRKRSHLIHAAILVRRDDRLAEHGVERKLGHPPAELRQLPSVVEGAKCVQLTQQPAGGGVAGNSSTQTK